MKINKDFKKIDSSSLVTGKPVYTEDLKDPNALIIKLMRSPYARCEILEIDKSRAEAMDGIVAVYTYEDVFDNKFTLAGQSYPEPSPYDMSILSKELRYMREPVAIVVGIS
ncbi:MAG: aldehyde oxidase, partial [Finegoldia magna]|nr:aldehyde oxidase [Finegoldia magna]